MDGPGGEDHRWRVHLWGPVRLVSPCDAEYRPTSRVVAELVAALALRRNGIVQRDEICALLWPEADPVSARNRLKQTLAVMRRQVPGFPVRANGKHEIEFPFDEIGVDVRELAERSRWLSVVTGQARIDAIVQLQAATEEALLPNVDTAWAETEKRTWRTRKAAWAQELANRPTGAKVFRLVEEVETPDIELIGREDKLAVIDRWFDREELRRLCVVGAPGVGKTRLLRAWMFRPEPAYDALLALSTSEAFETTWVDRLCDTLGAPSAAALKRRAITLFQGFVRPVLAVDDIDQAPDEIQTWIRELCAAVPRLRVISTSRRRPADASAVVDLAGLASGSQDSPASLLLHEFAVRDGLAERDLAQHAATLTALADRMEGLPLALEVIAAWLAFLSPPALQDRLARDSALLVEPSPRGGRSLLASVRRMSQDLSDSERSALVLFALARGGLGERLATRVLGSEWPWLVRKLAERSLIYPVHGKSGPRHAMLQALRQTLAHATPLEETARVREALRLACLDLLRAASHEAYDSDQAPWLDWLNDESENLIDALSSLTSEIKLLDRSFLGIVKLSPCLAHTSARRAFLRLIDTLTVTAYAHRDQMCLPVQNFFRLADLHARSATEGAGVVVPLIVEGIENGSIDAVGGWETVGSLQFASGLYEASLDSFQRCADVSSRAGLAVQAHWMDSFMAHSERMLGREEDSLARKKRARDFAEGRRLFNSVGVYDLESAGSCFAAGDVAAALSYAHSAVAAFAHANELRNRVRALLALAEFEIAAGQLAEALSHLEQVDDLVYPDDDELLNRRDKLVALWQASQ